MEWTTDLCGHPLNINTNSDLWVHKGRFNLNGSCYFLLFFLPAFLPVPYLDWRRCSTGSCRCRQWLDRWFWHGKPSEPRRSCTQTPVEESTNGEIYHVRVCVCVCVCVCVHARMHVCVCTCASRKKLLKIVKCTFYALHYFLWEIKVPSTICSE